MDNTALYKSLVDLGVIEKSLLDDAYAEATDAKEYLGKILLDRI